MRRMTLQALRASICRARKPFLPTPPFHNDVLFEISRSVYPALDAAPSSLSPSNPTIQKNTEYSNDYLKTQEKPILKSRWHIVCIIN